MTDFWKIDTETYTEIQKLTRFLDFISGLKYATELDKENCKIIKTKIENINNPETYKYWNVTLRIHLNQADGKINENLPHLKVWDVTFENNILEIEIKEITANNPLNIHYGDNFYFGGVIHFKQDSNIKNVFLSDSINLFISDALDYKKYLRNGFDDIDIDVDI